MMTDPALFPDLIGPTDTIRFTYDSYGNPVSIGRLETATELTDFIFRYDNEHRLTDVIGVFSLENPEGGGFDTWQKLYYKNGRIVLDTTFDFSIYDGGSRPIPFQPSDSSILIRRISTFEYLPKIITTEDAHSPFVAPVPFSFLNNLPLPLTVSYNCELPGKSGSQAY